MVAGEARKCLFFYMEKRKCRLDDPQEYALIKEIYFEKDLPQDIDLEEYQERRGSKIKNSNNNSR